MISLEELYSTFPQLNQICIEEGNGKRSVKSFALRTHKITNIQFDLLKKYHNKIWFDFPNTKVKCENFKITDLFCEMTKPTIIEIGFGNGEAGTQIALDTPQNNYLGIEVFLNGFTSYLERIVSNNIKNVSLIRGDATQLIKLALKKNEISGFNIFFPDPWPKKKHAKRRIITPSFVFDLQEKLKLSGTIHIATDIENYAMEIKEVFNSFDRLQLLNSEEIKKICRPTSYYERRGIKNGEKIFDLIYKKI